MMNTGLQGCWGQQRRTASLRKRPEAPAARWAGRAYGRPASRIRQESRLRRGPRARGIGSRATSATSHRGEATSSPTYGRRKRSPRTDITSSFQTTPRPELTWQRFPRFRRASAGGCGVAAGGGSHATTSSDAKPWAPQSKAERKSAGKVCAALPRRESDPCGLGLSPGGVITLAAPEEEEGKEGEVMEREEGKPGPP